MMMGQLDIHMSKKKMALDTNLTLITKFNSKWITDQKVKHKILKCLEHNIEESQDDVGCRGYFLDRTPKTIIA